MHRLLLFLFFALQGAAITFAQSPTPSSADSPISGSASSLLPNGDFAQASDGKWPDGWSHPDGATWESEGDVHFLRLQSAQPGQNILVYRQLVLPTPLPPGLELRLRVRYADVVPGEKSWFDARVMGHFENAEGKEITKAGFPAPYFRKSSKGWEDRSVFFAVPSNAHALDIMPVLFKAASGTFDLARVEIFPATADHPLHDDCPSQRGCRSPGIARGRQPASDRGRQGRVAAGALSRQPGVVGQGRAH